MKFCNQCKKLKHETHFHIKRYKSGHVGLRSYCKVCSKLSRDIWRKESPKDNERNKAYNRENAVRIRGLKLIKYWPGSTWKEANANYEALYKQQDGKCAICKRHKALLAVDHHHTKGHVRGLLCSGCNRALGYLQDSDVIIIAAAEYVIANK